MTQQKLTNILLAIIAAAIVIGLVLYFAAPRSKPVSTSTPLPATQGQPTTPPYTNPPTTPPTTTPTPNNAAPITPAPPTPALSGDKKTITLDGKAALSIDDAAIYNFFKATSLCDASNVNSTPERKLFCTDKTVFRTKTKFTSVTASPDNTKIGFTIENTELSPDKAVGLFYPVRTTGRVQMLTDYYLGNEFVGFSPSGINLAIKGGCFEGYCGLFIKNAETVAEKLTLGTPDGITNYTFVRWISDNEIEYKADATLKRAKF